MTHLFAHYHLAIARVFRDLLFRLAGILLFSMAVIGSGLPAAQADERVRTEFAEAVLLSASRDDR